MGQAVPDCELFGNIQLFSLFVFSLLLTTCGPVLLLILDRKYNKTLLSMETLKTSSKDLQKSLQGDLKVFHHYSSETRVEKLI